MSGLVNNVVGFLQTQLVEHDLLHRILIGFDKIGPSGRRRIEWQRFINSFIVEINALLVTFG
ncbi:hypothetical protein D3C87_1903820 [compost metagenome]